MNKQFVLAALLATTQAADCKDAYTDLADAELAAAKAAKTAAEGRVKKSEELVAAQLINVEAMKVKQDPIDLLVKPFSDHLVTAKAAFVSANGAYNNASDGSTVETIDLGKTDVLGLWNNVDVKMQFTAKKTDLTTLEKAKLTSQSAREGAEADLVTLKSAKTKYDAELVRRKAQELLYQTATSEATAAKEKFDKLVKKAAQWVEAIKLTYDQTKTDPLINAELAKPAYDQLVKLDMDAVALWRLKEKDAVAAELLATSAKGDMDTAWTQVEGQKALENKKYTDSVIYSIGTVCDTAGGLCKDGDQVFTDRAGNITAFSALTTKITAYALTVTAYEGKYDTGVAARQVSDVKKLDYEAMIKVVTDAKTAADTDPAKDVKSAGYYANAQKATANGQMDCTNTDKAIMKKEAEIQRLKNNEIVVAHIYDLAKDKFDNLQAVKDAALDAKDHAQKQQTLAQTSFDRATAKLKVYKDQYAAASSMKGDADADLVLYKGQVTAADGKVTVCTAKQTAAVANCKGVKYKIAQETYKKWDAQNVKNKETAASVATEYAAEAKAPTDGAAGTRCEFPKKAADGTQAARPKCADELCCGAANKYMRDGTRLTVETCQPSKGTHTYKFFPKLKAGALVKPRTELWRFYCIQGAQKLAAALAAGVGAAYFMA